MNPMYYVLIGGIFVFSLVLGQVRRSKRWSYQAMAHGADTIQFFQIRRSPGSCEKYHGAIIDHVGHGNTRVFRECAALGKELADLKDRTLGGRTPAKVGILFDWNNWWAIEYSAGPTRQLKYVDEVLNYYTAFHRYNIPVDLIGCECTLPPPQGCLDFAEKANVWLTISSFFPFGIMFSF